MTEESAEHGRLRFEIEAEFVSLCADPTYLNFLASEGYTARPEFQRYCAYLLRTWTQPAYAKHVRYPQGLTNLHLLIDDSFRSSIAVADAARAAQESQLGTWKARADVLFHKLSAATADDAPATVKE